MRRLIRFLGVVAIAGLSAAGIVGCAMVHTPITGFLYTDVKAPICATSQPTSSKVGTSTCKSILGWIAVGDASIDAAAKNGRITKIKHVDYEGKSVLGIYATYTVRVYGD